MIRYILILFIGFSITACSMPVDSCDPRNFNVGFMTNVSCYLSGTYDKRIKEKEKILSDAIKINHKYRQIKKTIEAQDTTKTNQKKSNNKAK